MLSPPPTVFLPSPEDTVAAKCNGSTGKSVGASAEKDANTPWLPRKIRQCGEVIRVTVRSCDKGWDNVVDFVQERDRQIKSPTRKDKVEKKGKRELNNLACWINYEGSRKRSLVNSGRTDRLPKGDPKGNS